MTREQAAKYLDHPLNQLGVNRREFGEPVEDAWESRVRFDAWVSWALHTICGYPDNLFQGDSSGDGRGAFVDDPSRDDIMNRVERGARVLKHIIVGKLSQPHDLPLSVYVDIMQVSMSSPELRIHRSLDTRSTFLTRMIGFFRTLPTIKRYVSTGRRKTCECAWRTVLGRFLAMKRDGRKPTVGNWSKRADIDTMRLRSFPDVS